MSEKVTVEMTKESFEFLTKLANTIAKQDNRCTAAPYFYVVKTPEWKICADGYGYGDTKTVKLCREDDTQEWELDDKEKYIRQYIDDRARLSMPDELLTDDSDEALKEEWADYNEEQSKYRARAAGKWEDLEEVQLHLVDDLEDNVFFTFEGYQEHVRQNKHNMGRGEGFHSYVKHAYRNPEMESLWKAIQEFKTKEGNNEQK